MAISMVELIYRGFLLFLGGLDLGLQSDSNVAVTVGWIGHF
jgi:hypothetical protein